jgi:Mg2+ and Co2+ transporter CorA
VTEIPVNGTAWRLTSIEARISRIEVLEPAVLAERIHTQTVDLGELRDEVRSLRRALYSFALSISLAAIVFGVTMLQVVRVG